MEELQSYVSALQLGGRAEGTIKNYLFNIDKFLKFTGVADIKELDGLTKEDYRNFVREQQSLGNMKNSTINNIIRSVNAFFNWLLDEGKMVNDSLPEMNFGGRRRKFLKEDKLVNKFLPEDVAQAIQDACTRMDERLMIALLRHGGMRAGEIAGIRISNIRQYTADDGTLQYRILLTHTKGDKERFVRIPRLMVDAIFDYVKTRKHDSDFLFIGLGTHKPITPVAIYARVKRLASSVIQDEELLSRISPHSFRHTAATNWLNQGMSFAQVAMALGHGDDAQVTRRYAHLDGKSTMADKVFNSQTIKI